MGNCIYSKRDKDIKQLRNDLDLLLKNAINDSSENRRCSREITVLYKQNLKHQHEIDQLQSRFNKYGMMMSGTSDDQKIEHSTTNHI